MVQHDLITKVAITGNTKLTLESMKMISDLDNFEILYVFGLPHDKLSGKVNSVHLDKYCEENDIFLDKTNEWKNCLKFCEENEIGLIITLGDSRIVPKAITDNFKVIGNHGAILPEVQGGASLVWGRMLESCEWGISIMKIEGRVDSGDILKIKKFNYSPTLTEAQFVNICDNLTVQALKEVLLGDYEITQNKRWDIRISRGTDSYKTYQIFKYCIENKLNIYLPPRSPSDGVVNSQWPDDFKQKFKKACDAPYPKWK
tara:strand:+ start:145 stop:918 length:774 start_codon:yes stop_codon:yes gene_type:complete